jgi:hypothetical protein
MKKLLAFLLFASLCTVAEGAPPRESERNDIGPAIKFRLPPRVYASIRLVAARHAKLFVVGERFTPRGSVGLRIEYIPRGSSPRSLSLTADTRGAIRYTEPVPLVGGKTPNVVRAVDTKTGSTTSTRVRGL